MKGSVGILRSGAPTHDTGVTGYSNILVLSDTTPDLHTLHTVITSENCCVWCVLLNIIYGTDRMLGVLKLHTRISTFTARHFVVAREQPDVMSPRKLKQLKHFRLRAKGPLLLVKYEALSETDFM